MNALLCELISIGSGLSGTSSKAVGNTYTNTSVATQHGGTGPGRMYAVISGMEDVTMRTSEERLYIAYGSNLNLEQMKRRCPTAEVIGKAVLSNWQLWFRGSSPSAVATIERKQGGKVPVLIWRLQPKDEQALDQYEGFPFLYRKARLRVTLNGRRVYAMAYIMNKAGHPYGAPSSSYLNSIREGYESAGFDGNILMDAVRRSKEEKKWIQQ